MTGTEKEMSTETNSMSARDLSVILVVLALTLATGVIYGYWAGRRNGYEAGKKEANRADSIMRYDDVAVDLAKCALIPFEGVKVYKELQPDNELQPDSFVRSRFWVTGTAVKKAYTFTMPCKDPRLK